MARRPRCCPQVLWAALFSLAVLVREGGDPFEPACRVAAGSRLQSVRTACDFAPGLARTCCM